MSLIVISVDNGGGAEVNGETLLLIIIANNSVNKRTSERYMECFALVSDFLIM